MQTWLKILIGGLIALFFGIFAYIGITFKEDWKWTPLIIYLIILGILVIIILVIVLIKKFSTRKEKIEKQEEKEKDIITPEEAKKRGILKIKELFMDYLVNITIITKNIGSEGTEKDPIFCLRAESDLDGKEKIYHYMVNLKKANKGYVCEKDLNEKQINELMNALATNPPIIIEETVIPGTEGSTPLIKRKRATREELEEEKEKKEEETKVAI